MLMRTPEQEARLAPARLLGLLRARWRWALGIIVAATLAAFLYSSLVLAADPTYRTAATLDISPSRSELDYANSFVRNSPLQIAGVVTQTYAEYVLSRPVITSVADEYLRQAGPTALDGGQSSQGLREWLRDLNSGRAQTQNPREAFIDSLRESTTVETVSGTYLLRIEVAWDDPRLAARFANALAARLMAEAAARTTVPAARLNQQLAAQLGQTRARLGERLNQAARARAGMGVVDLPTQRRALVEERLAEEARLTNELAQISAGAAQVGALQRQANGRLSASLPAIEQALALERPRLAGVRQSIRHRSVRLGRIDSRLARLSGAEARLGGLDLEIQALQAQITALSERLNAVQLDSLGQGTTVRMVEEARPPIYRDSPKVLVNTALGFIAGCALAGMLMLVAPARVSAAGTTPPSEPPIAEPRTYAGILRAPRSRGGFSLEESRTIREKLGSWLAEPLGDPGCALFVIAASRDVDSTAVHNLLRGFLHSRGEDVVAPMETAEGSGRSLAAHGRVIANCGGLAQSANIPSAARGGELVLVVRDKEDPAAYVEGLLNQLSESGWARPYVIRIEP